MDELTWMQASRTQTFSRHASSYCTGRAQENPVLQIDVVTLDERNFDQVVAGGSTPLVVRFWAPWCGSCRALAPTFGDLSREYVNRAKFAEVNVDENPSLARRFLVRAIPTILVLHRGVVLGHTIGARSDLQLRAILDAAM
ncbi:MAG: thioredoxin family protein [Dehalococcoidia bacterium]